MHPAPPTIPLEDPAAAWWSDLRPRDDRSINTLLQAESEAGRRQRSVYELFTEMESKDGHLFSLLQTRLTGLLGLERRLAPPAAVADPDTVEWIAAAMGRIPDFDGLLRALLTGIARGFAVVELHWHYGPGGRLEVAGWREHPQEFFAFAPDGGLLLLAPPFRQPTGDDPQVPGAEGARSPWPARAFPAPPRKFLVLRHRADARNPYGRGLCQHAYWYYHFKKNALKGWAVYNDRFGSPAAVARYAPGTSRDEREELRRALQELQAESSIVLPDTIRLELLEAGRSGDGATFQRFLDWCNDEMAKLVLGATLTSGEGRRSGSLALGSIHQLVRQDYIDSDARLVESVVNDQLIRWLMELNLPAATAPPGWRIRTDSPVDQEASIAIDRALLGLGVRLPLSWFHQRYGRPLPAAGEEVLRYDDANFYQYHLQFGVLTVNEVRERLGLAPVPWGDGRTVEAGAAAPPSAARSGEDNGRPPL